MASRVWKDGTRRGIAYVEGRAAAEQVMTAAGRTIKTPSSASSAAARDKDTEGAMAVYSDRRGRPFAWQIPFDIGHWDRIVALLTPSESNSSN